METETPETSIRTLYRFPARTLLIYRVSVEGALQASFNWTWSGLPAGLANEGPTEDGEVEGEHMYLNVFGLSKRFIHTAMKCACGCCR